LNCSLRLVSSFITFLMSLWVCSRFSRASNSSLLTFYSSLLVLTIFSSLIYRVFFICCSRVYRYRSVSLMSLMYCSASFIFSCRLLTSSAYSSISSCSFFFSLAFWTASSWASFSDLARCSLRSLCSVSLNVRRVS
jgi:hypothetical protein